MSPELGAWWVLVAVVITSIFIGFYLLGKEAGKSVSLEKIDEEYFSGYNKGYVNGYSKGYDDSSNDLLDSDWYFDEETGELI